jgi:hypothetical protein
MEEETEVVAPEEEITKKAPRRKSIVSVRLVEALNQTERYCTIAQRATVAPALTAREVPTDFVVDLLNDIAACRALLATFVQETTDRQVHTETERTKRARLVLALQGVQNGAKRKWGRKPGEKDKLKAYYVGVTLRNLSTAELAEAADTILQQARLTTLPDVSAAELTALDAAIVAWKAANEAQALAQTTASTAHTSADALAKSILDRRIELQLAADKAFPYDETTNASLRKEFGLPKNGPYSAL